MLARLKHGNNTTKGQIMAKITVRLITGYTRPEQVITWQTGYGDNCGIAPTIMSAKTYPAGAGFMYSTKRDAKQAIADIATLGGLAVIEV